MFSEWSTSKEMDSSISTQPGSPVAKISNATPVGTLTDGAEHPPRRRRRCPARGSESASGRMSVNNSASETVDDADMECSDGEAVDTEDEEVVFQKCLHFSYSWSFHNFLVTSSFLVIFRHLLP